VPTSSSGVGATRAQGCQLDGAVLVDDVHRDPSPVEAPELVVREPTRVIDKARRQRRRARAPTQLATSVDPATSVTASSERVLDAAADSLSTE